MTDSPTPICDLIESLLSRQMSPGDAISVARKMEITLAGPARSRVTPEEQRLKWRTKKQRQRAAVGNVPGGQKAEGINTVTPNSPSQLKKERKHKQAASPDVPGDDWPADYEDQFWNSYPPFRRQSRRKVNEKLARIRADAAAYRASAKFDPAKHVTWLKIITGVDRYREAEKPEYCCAPMVWLNNDRWDRAYGPNGGKPDGQRTDDRPASATESIIAAARRRAGGGGLHGGARGGGADPIPSAGRLGPGGRAGSGGRPDGSGDAGGGHES